MEGWTSGERVPREEHLSFLLGIRDLQVGARGSLALDEILRILPEQDPQTLKDLPLFRSKRCSHRSNDGI